MNKLQEKDLLLNEDNRDNKWKTETEVLIYLKLHTLFLYWKNL